MSKHSVLRQYIWKIQLKSRVAIIVAARRNDILIRWANTLHCDKTKGCSKRKSGAKISGARWKQWEERCKRIGCTHIRCRLQTVGERCKRIRCKLQQTPVSRFKNEIKGIRCRKVQGERGKVTGVERFKLQNSDERCKVPGVKRPDAKQQV